MRAKAMVRSVFLSATLLLVPLLATNASASVAVRVDLSQQRMTVAVDGVHYATWAVSTARPGYRTPVGHFRPYHLARMHYSSIYENAPMPHSIFFRGGYAIHGTLEVRRLGRAVSHGCVRLAPGNARVLFDLVQAHGLAGTSITITR